MPPPRTYKSPLEGYENAPALPTEKAEDGKSLLNIQTGVLSKAYNEFPEPLDNGRRGALYVIFFNFFFSFLFFFPLLHSIFPSRFFHFPSMFPRLP